MATREELKVVKAWDYGRSYSLKVGGEQTSFGRLLITNNVARVSHLNI